MDINIAPEDGVPYLQTKPKERKRDKARYPHIQRYIDAFAKFRPGQSFFIPGVTRKDVEFLRQPFATTGLGVLMREVTADQKYGTPGVRIWRLHGEYDNQAAPPAASDYDPDLDGPQQDEDDEL